MRVSCESQWSMVDRGLTSKPADLAHVELPLSVSCLEANAVITTQSHGAFDNSLSCSRIETGLVDLAGTEEGRVNVCLPGHGVRFVIRETVA